MSWDSISKIVAQAIHKPCVVWGIRLGPSGIHNLSCLCNQRALSFQSFFLLDSNNSMLWSFTNWKSYISYQCFLVVYLEKQSCRSKIVPLLSHLYQISASFAVNSSKQGRICPYKHSVLVRQDEFWLQSMCNCVLQQKDMMSSTY